MTEDEALDMAAKAAGWRDWREAHERTWELDGMRAHAATIMENAENARLLSMSAEREINLRGELLRLQRKNAALKAENERLREALELCLGELYAPEEACSCHISPPCGDCVEYSSIRNAITIARAALKEIEGD